MNCEQFWKHSEEAGAMTEESLAHLSQCAECAGRQQIEHDLRALAAQERKLEAPPRVEAFLLAEFRRSARGPRLVAAPRPLPAWRMPALWAAAAALVLMLSALWHVPGHPVHFVSAAGEAGIQPADTDLADDNNGFIPLPNAEGLAPSDDVNVVSVEVPRSAVVAAGIPLTDDGPSELVKADVMLGPDGMPRAIRLAN